MTIREQLLEIVDDALFLEPAEFDEAILGIAERIGSSPVVAYDREKCIEILARDMPRDEAEEFFEFNTAGAWVGESTPMMITIVKAGDA